MSESENQRQQLTRRQFLGRTSGGLGVAALASILDPNLLRGTDVVGGGWPMAPRARRVIYLTQAGAPSQLDLFDYKPGLKGRFKKELPESVRAGQRLTGMTSGQRIY